MGDNSLTVRGRKWEKKNSRWTLWSIFLLAGVGFIKIGRRAKEKKWIVIGVFYLVFLWGGLCIVDILDEKTMEIYSMIYFAVYIGSIVHSFIVKKSYLLKYDKVLYKQEIELEEEKIKRNLLEQEKIKKQKNIELEKEKILQEYEQVKTNNTQIEKENKLDKANGIKIQKNVDEDNSLIEENNKSGETLVDNDKVANQSNVETFTPTMEENDNKSNAGNVMRWIVLPIGLLIVDVWLFFTFSHFNDFHAWAPVLEIIMAVVFLFWAIFGIMSWNNTCPECKAWDALEEIDKQIINVRNITINKTVEEKVYKANGMYTHKMEPSQVIERKVSVPGKEYTYDITLKCKKCGYITHKTTTEKVED